jgi:hypothetical protein
MNIFNLKNNINEQKIKSKKTISLIGKTIGSDWKMMMSFLFGCLIVALAFSWTMYKSAVSQSFLSEEDTLLQAGTLRVNTQQLDRVISDLNYKKEKFNKLTGGITFDETSESVSTSTPETR